MARQYNKRSDYWKNRQLASIKPEIKEITAKPIDLTPTFDNNEHYSALAACGNGSDTGNSYRNGVSPVIQDTARYKNIREGLIPFLNNTGGYYSVAEAIALVYKAYFNVPAVRNTINLLQDFSVSPLHIKTENETVKKFFQAWFDAIGLNNFMAQFFLEYYRSGNVFMYKFNGKIPDNKFNVLKEAFGAKQQELPVRYIILDPQQVYLQIGPNYSYNYVRMLSTYEIARLRDPKTPEDKATFKDLPPEIQRQIKQYSNYEYLYVPIDVKRLYYAFYRKQDYEPLAIPMAFPVLNDIEAKLELKKMDMSLARTIEQVILLVTTGDRADQYNAGVNPKNLQALQNIFKNQTLGRVLVADYSTEAKFIMPDIKDLLGPQKYAQVDADIKEGLQYMFFGQEKYANATIKAKIFVESLREGRRVFLDNFLRPEAKKICEAMNFKNLPVFEFEDIDVEDKSAIQRLYVQMAQLGLLTNDELNTALETGVLPDKLSSENDQQQYKKFRDKGLYTPLAPAQQGVEGRPAGSGKSMPNKKVGKIGSAKASFSMDKIIDNIADMNELQGNVEKALKKKYKLRKLSDIQRDVGLVMTKSIIVNEDKENWENSIEAYIKSPKDIPQEVYSRLDEIKEEYSDTENTIDDWTAIMLYKSEISGS